MALLALRGCAAPAVHAPPAGSRLLPLPPPRRFNGLLRAVRRGGVVVSGRPRGYGTVLGGPNGNAVATATSTKSTIIETTVERVIFDFRFLALLAVAGSLAPSGSSANDDARGQIVAERSERGRSHGLAAERARVRANRGGASAEEKSA